MPKRAKPAPATPANERGFCGAAPQNPPQPNPPQPEKESSMSDTTTIDALPLTEADLNDQMGPTPRIHDLRLAEALGMNRLRDIRQLIERNFEELNDYGPLVGQVTRSQDEMGRGRNGTEYWLNEEQALLICMFSRTEQAALVRRQVIRLYMAWKRGQELPPPPRGRRQDDLSEYLRGSGEVSVESVQNRLSYWKHQRDYAQERVDSLLERFPLLNRPRR